LTITDEWIKAVLPSYTAEQVDQYDRSGGRMKPSIVVIDFEDPAINKDLAIGLLHNENAVLYPHVHPVNSSFRALKLVSGENGEEVKSFAITKDGERLVVDETKCSWLPNVPGDRHSSLSTEDFKRTHDALKKRYPDRRIRDSIG
jgi:hypothetical protein